MYDLSGHQQRPRKVVGELLHAISLAARHFTGLHSIRRHRVPREEVKELVRDIEVPASQWLSPIDEDRMQPGQVDGCA